MAPGPPPPRYLHSLFALAHDASAGVRKEVVVGLVQLVTVQPDKLAPFLYQVCACGRRRRGMKGGGGSWSCGRKGWRGERWVKLVLALGGGMQRTPGTHALLFSTQQQLCHAGVGVCI